MEEKNTPTPSLQGGESARQKYLARMRERVPDVDDWEDENARYGAYLRYDDEQQQHLGKYRESNQKLTDLFARDPRFAALMRDVVKGDDPSVAFVRYYGQEALDAAGDEEKIKLITAANKEYLNRVAESEKLHQAQEENLQKSQEEMTTFQQEKGLSDEQFAGFIDAVYNVLEKGLEGLLTADFLETFWNGLHYENDLREAAATGRTEGRNDKITLENRVTKGDQIPNLREGTGSGDRPVAPKKRRSFYSGGPGYTD